MSQASLRRSNRSRLRLDQSTRRVNNSRNNGERRINGVRQQVRKSRKRNYGEAASSRKSTLRNLSHMARRFAQEHSRKRNRIVTYHDGVIKVQFHNNINSVDTNEACVFPPCRPSVLGCGDSSNDAEKHHNYEYFPRKTCVNSVQTQTDDHLLEIPDFEICNLLDLTALQEYERVIEEDRFIFMENQSTLEDHTSGQENQATLDMGNLNLQLDEESRYYTRKIIRDSIMFNRPVVFTENC